MGNGGAIYAIASISSGLIEFKNTKCTSNKGLLGGLLFAIVRNISF